MTKQNSIQHTENFAELFEESMKSEKKEGSVVEGIITEIRNNEVVIDVGLKSEGRVSIKEFQLADHKFDYVVGDKVEVYVERTEDRDGNTVLSREKAVREEAWFKFEDLYKKGINVDGIIIGRVKGGFAVDLGGIIAFLPGSQVDIRPIRDISVLLNLQQPFKILKMDRSQGNVVVSRRAILEESRAEARDALLSTIQEGSVLEGTIKNITDYGAFIDLGSIDGLLHITDISWNKISHPSEMLTLGQQIKVMVIKYNEETKRVSLGLKQLEKNPWDNIMDKYKQGTRVKGTITTIADYGAFVELEPNVEGLVYHTEISWHAKNTHPRKLLKTGDKVEAVILEFDLTKHKISLSIKQCFENPWKKFAEKYQVGSAVEGVVQNIAEFGIFVLIKGETPEFDIEALVPAVELSWDEKPENELKKYKKGDEIKGIVVAMDVDRERVTVGVKQLTKNVAMEALTGKYNKGEVVTCTVTEVKKDGIAVEVADNMRAFIKKPDLSKHKSEQRPERFGVGDKVDAQIIAVDLKEKKLVLSIKALEVEEEKRAIAEYGSRDSGASLGEILGVALGKDLAKLQGASADQSAAKEKAKSKAKAEPKAKAKAEASSKKSSKEKKEAV